MGRVQEGRSVSLAGDTPDYYVTFGIQPDRLFQDDPYRTGDLVYFELPRPDNLSADVFAASVPNGMQVALFGYRVDESTGSVTGADNGREPGATLYRPDVQGLFTQTSGRPMESILEPLSDMSLAWRKLGSLRELVKAAE